MSRDMEQIIYTTNRRLELSVTLTPDDMSTHTVQLFLVNDREDRIAQAPAFEIDYPHDTDIEIMSKVFTQAYDKIRARLAAKPSTMIGQLVHTDDFSFPWKVYRRDADGTAYWIDNDGMLRAAPLMILGGIDLQAPAFVANFEDNLLTKDDLIEIYQALGFDLWRGILGGVPTQKNTDFNSYEGRNDVVGLLIYKQAMDCIAVLDDGIYYMNGPNGGIHSGDLSHLEEKMAIWTNNERGLLPSDIQLRDTSDWPENTNENSLAGMRCPNCGHFESFNIEVKCTVAVTDEGAGDLVDPEWDDNSHCTCRACGHQGKVSNFRTETEA